MERGMEDKLMPATKKGEAYVVKVKELIIPNVREYKKVNGN